MIELQEAAAVATPDAEGAALAALVPGYFAAGYERFRDQVLAHPAVGAPSLAALRAQAEALALVWEAHVRGAITLPAPLAERVLAARAVTARLGEWGALPPA